MLSKHVKSASQRKSGKKAKRLAQKREEAKSRQTIHNSLSIEEKISLAKSRRGVSGKEISRLNQITILNNVENVLKETEG